MIYEICGDVAPAGLVGLKVRVVPEPLPRYDRLVTVRPVDKQAAIDAYAVEGFWMPMPETLIELRLPPANLRPSGTDPRG